MATNEPKGPDVVDPSKPQGVPDKASGAPIDPNATPAAPPPRPLTGRPGPGAAPDDRPSSVRAHYQERMRQGQDPFPQVSIDEYAPEDNPEAKAEEARLASESPDAEHAQRDSETAPATGGATATTGSGTGAAARARAGGRSGGRA